MREVLICMAICGLVYGAYALYAVGGFSDAQRQQCARQAQEIAEHARATGLRGMAFRLGQPLFWLISLPIVSSGAALFLALLLILPALLVK